MKNFSVWQEGNKKNSFPKLANDIEVDVLIIGGGITGISTLYHLKDTGLRVALVERNEVAGGISARTTGKLTFLQDILYTKILKNYGYETSKLYYESQKEAIDTVVNIVNDNNISCDLVKQKSYLFTNESSNIDVLKDEKELLRKWGEDVIENDLLEVDNKYNISVRNTYYFHPVKYLNHLAGLCVKENIKIYENTNILEIKKEDNVYVCKTKDRKIKANKVVIASHYPYFLFPLLMPLKAHMEKSYLLCKKANNPKNVSAINIDTDTISFRYFQDNFIFLNNSHNTAFKFDNKNNYNKVKNKIELLDNNYYFWSNTDILTNDKMPYIGKIKDNLYVGTGYNTWGMTNGTIAGKVISDLILEKENKYTKLFNPKREEINNFISYIVNIFSNSKPFIQNKINKGKPFYSSKVEFKKENGLDIAIYTDEHNKKHIVYNKCPHLKCNLIFNEVEKTWDCPCHASRFDIDGKCITGPSNYDITYKD